MQDSWRNRLLEAEEATVRRGYDAAYRCLFCQAQSGGEEAAQAHLAGAHGSVLAALLQLEKGLTGLTDKQKDLIRLWQSGVSDAQIAAQTGVSTSTLRNQRFALREREREARLLLMILSLSGLSALRPGKAIGHTSRREGIDQFFQQGKLLSMPARESKKELVMQRFAALFTPGQTYTHREVRDIISPVWEDHAFVRRWLVDHHVLQRTTDGRTYWMEAPSTEKPELPEPSEQEKEAPPMAIDKKAAKLAYKNTIPPMGIYCITDAQSGRSVIAADRNLPSVMNRFSFLQHGGTQPAGPFSDPQLYKDYLERPEAFSFEILEQVDVAKCATYEEAVEKLEALQKGLRARYADRPQYQYK